MGLTEVLPRLPKLIRRINETVSDVTRAKPDVLVTIDSPGFTFRVAKKLKGKGIPLVHYVAPTVWAWKPKRAKKIAQFLDHLMVLLPFEPPYFTAEGLPTTFVGHPVVERGADRGDGDAFRVRHGMPADAPLLCVLPGSRVSETSKLLETFKETVRHLKESHPDLRVVIPTVSRPRGFEAAKPLSGRASRSRLVQGSTAKLATSIASSHQSQSGPMLHPRLGNELA